MRRNIPAYSLPQALGPSSRAAALRTAGLAAPRYPGFRLGAAARLLGPRAWGKEYAGMLRRIVTRGLWRRGRHMRGSRS